MSNNDYMQEMIETYKKSLNQGGGDRKFSRVVCPHTYDTKIEKNNCVLCDICRETIFDRSKPREDPIKGTAKRFSFKKKYYSNILIMVKPDEVHLLEYGDKVFNKLIALQADELSEYKNFMHPTAGRNLYITKVKIGPEPKDVDYNVEPRIATSPLPDLKIVTKLHNLDDVVAALMAGKLIPLSQAKFEFKKTEIRILPNGNKLRPLFFYKMVLWHENLTQEEFNAVQEGKYNPLTGLYTVATPAPVMAAPTAVVTKPPKQESPADLLAEWGLSEDSAGEQESVFEEGDIAAEGGDEEMEMDTSAEPICFGQYDKNNAVCNSKCIENGWGEPCRKIYEEKLAIRAKAKRLTR